MADDRSVGRNGCRRCRLRRRTRPRRPRGRLPCRRCRRSHSHRGPPHTFRDAQRLARAERRDHGLTWLLCSTCRCSGAAPRARHPGTVPLECGFAEMDDSQLGHELVPQLRLRRRRAVVLVPGAAWWCDGGGAPNRRVGRRRAPAGSSARRVFSKRPLAYCRSSM